MKLKVYAGLTFVRGKQCRTIVAAPSKKAALEALETVGAGRMSMYEFTNYWSATGNKIELEVALAKPLTVFRANGTDRYDFKEVVEE